MMIATYNKQLAALGRFPVRGSSLDLLKAAQSILRPDGWTVSVGAFAQDLVVAEWGGKCLRLFGRVCC